MLKYTNCAAKQAAFTLALYHNKFTVHVTIYPVTKYLVFCNPLLLLKFADVFRIIPEIRVTKYIYGRVKP